jgi:glutathione S-transferase
MAPTEKPIVFHYPQSIYSHRVLWYLWLRNIPYDECIQPPVMPRPDLASIGVGYRKMPVLSIGKDVYCDSRLIISKLEELHPNSILAPSTLAEAGVRKLFESYTVDGGIFANAVKLIPYWTDASLLQNKAFLDDRQKLMGGRRMTKEAMEAGRPDGLQHMRQAFDLLETTFLADERDWILGTKGPTVADIDAVWPFEWLVVDHGMRESLPEELISEMIYPKAYAWIRRFMGLVEKRKATCPTPTMLDGKTMASSTLGAASSTNDIGFIANDPLDGKQGDQVSVFPSDYGQMDPTIGALVSLSTNEVVIRNDKDVYVHFPRWNFAIKKIIPSLTSSPQPAQPPKRIPKMRLMYHPFSPFARKVVVLAHELGLVQQIKFQKVVICPVPFPGWSDNNDDVSKYNPMAKIPCLISEDVPDGIYDSDVICEYLEDLASVSRKKDARYWQLHTLHACADGILDAVVLITYEVRIRKERGLFFEEWMKGQQHKILRGLDRLEVAARDGVLPDPARVGPGSADEVTIAVAAATTESTGYLGIDWKGERTHLESWKAKWEQRKSFVDTPPGIKDWAFDAVKKSASKI